MGNYLIPLHRTPAANRLYMSDGGLWIGYKANGMSLNSFDNDQTITGTQLAHVALLRNLAKIKDINEVMICGIKTSETFTNMKNKIVHSLPEVQRLDKKSPSYLDNVSRIINNYPGIIAQLQQLKTDLESLSTMSFHREYFFFFSVENSLSMYDKLVSKIWQADVHYKIHKDYIESLNKKLLKAFSGYFNVSPSTPKDLLNIAKRRMFIGCPAPNILSEKGRYGEITLDSFPNAEIDLSPGVDYITSEIIAELNNPAKKEKNLSESILKKINYYKNTHTLLSRDLDSVSPDFPNGLRSYQNNIYIAAKSRTIKESSIHDMTFLCDQIGDIDADWTIRLTYDRTLTSNKDLDNKLNALEVEQKDNSFTAFDAAKYDRDMSDIVDLWQECFNENNAIGCRASVLFHLGAMNLDKLENGTDSFKQLLSGNGLETVSHPGGCFEAMKLGFPGSPRHSILDTASLATTVANLAASAPIRSNQVGDTVGFPFFFSRENSLNQFVYWDILNTTRVNTCGDLLISGAMGSGKSYLMKNILGVLNDFLIPVFAIDSEGEYAVYASCLPDHVIVYLNSEGSQKYTIDPLVVFRDKPGLAAQVWMDTVYPMLGIPDEDVITRSRAEMLVNPEKRQAHIGVAGVGSLESSRDIWAFLRGKGDKGSVDNKLFSALNSLAVSSFTAAIFNPIDSLGNMKRLPPVDVSQGLSTVFRLNDLTLPSSERRESFEKIPTSQRYTVGVVNILDHILNKQFATRPGVKATYVDEVHKYNSTKLMVTIRTIAKEGRKKGLFGIYASPSPLDFPSDVFATSGRRVGMSQASLESAHDEAVWTGAPMKNAAARLIQGFSPREKIAEQSTRVVPGREGEGVYNDAFGGFGVVQSAPQLLYTRDVYANTNSETRMRESDLEYLMQ